MKSFIVVALLVASAYAGSSQVSGLLDSLDSLMVRAYSSKNTRAIEAIEDAKETVMFAANSIRSSKNGDVAAFEEAIVEVRSNLAALEKMVSLNIKSRNFFGDSFNAVRSGVGMVTSTVSSTVSKLSSSGLGGLMAIFEPFIENIKNNPSVHAALKGLKTLESAIEGLNKMTGGSIAPLNTLSDILTGLDTATETVDTVLSVNSTEALADSLIKVLRNAKSNNLEKINKGIDYVCSGVVDAEAKNSVTVFP